MTANGSPILERTLNSGQFDIPEQRIELGGLRKVGPFNWLAHRMAGLVLGTPSVKGAEALSLNPWLLWPWFVYGASITPLRRRRDPNIQLVILRTVWNAHGRYEWYVHFHVSRLGGVSPQTIERVTRGPGDPGWTEEQRALIQAVDEVQRDRVISDVTWKALSPFMTERRLAEFFFVVGLYDQLAMLFNSVGLSPEQQRYDWAPLMLTRRPDDSDALLPERFHGVDRFLVRRLAGVMPDRIPYSQISIGARTVSAIVFADGEFAVVPLPYGSNRRWVGELLTASSAQVAVRDRTLAIEAPRILDATQTQHLPVRVQRLSKLMPVLVASIV